MNKLRDGQIYQNGFVEGYLKAINDMVAVLCEVDCTGMPVCCIASMCEGSCKECISEIQRTGAQLKEDKYGRT